MFRIIEAKAQENYKVWVKFSDGVEGTVDLSDMVGKGVFAQWEDKNFFNLVFIDPEAHTLAWPEGIDLSPETLYAEVSGKKIDEIINNTAAKV